jgi:ADP-heptose:LPS heptosyltransferase
MLEGILDLEEKSCRRCETIKMEDGFDKMPPRNSSVRPFGFLARARRLIRSALFRAVTGRGLGLNRRKVEICIFKLDSIGDFVLGISAIRYICNVYGEENVALLISKDVATVVDMEFPRVVRLYMPAFSSGIFRYILLYFSGFRRCLAGFHFKRLICLRHARLEYQQLVLSWISADVKIVVETPYWNRIYPERGLYDVVRWDDSEADMTKGIAKDIVCHAKALSAMQGATVDFREIIPGFTSLVKSEGKDIVVSPFLKESIRNFPEDLLLGSLLALNKKFPGRTIRLLGAPNRFRELSELRKKMSDGGVENLSDLDASTDLKVFIRTVAQALFILTVDTSTAHIATALDKRAIILLGGGHYGWFGPWSKSDKQLWLSNFVSCFHCNWHCPYVKPLCIAGITLGTIQKAIDKLA